MTSGLAIRGDQLFPNGCSSCDVRVSSRYRTLMLRGALANQVDRGLCLPGQVGCRPVTVKMHVEDAGILEEEVIVHRRDFESVIEKSGHDRIDFVFQEHKVTHHHVHSTVAFGHRKPASEAEAALAVYLQRLTGTPIDMGLADRDLDTGQQMVPGGYPLTDRTYAQLIARITKVPTEPIPAGLKQDIIAYYADPAAPISTKKRPKEWAAVQKQLQVLMGIKTISE